MTKRQFKVDSIDLLSGLNNTSGVSLIQTNTSDSNLLPGTLYIQKSDTGSLSGTYNSSLNCTANFSLSANTIINGDLIASGITIDCACEEWDAVTFVLNALLDKLRKSLQSIKK